MRKSEIVTVPEWGGRDAGHLFKLTEMPAVRAEKWALRMGIVLKGTKAEIPSTVAPLGMIAVAIIGLNMILAADIEFEKLEPLLDEMMDCVQIIRDPMARDIQGQMVATRIITDDDIQEARTISWLRLEVLRVHTNFPFFEDLCNWWAAASKTMATSPST